MKPEILQMLVLAVAPHEVHPDRLRSRVDPEIEELLACSHDLVLDRRRRAPLQQATSTDAPASLSPCTNLRLAADVAYMP